MPAQDRYHRTVVRALVKDGWEIVDEQVALILTQRHLWIDIHAAKADENRAILVEVKGFENMPSPVHYLANAVGKYILYRSALNFLEVDMPLYMAVPAAAYYGVLSEDVGKQAIEREAVRLIVFDPENEEIIQWIP